MANEAVAYIMVVMVNKIKIIIIIIIIIITRKCKTCKYAGTNNCMLFFKRVFNLLIKTLFPLSFLFYFFFSSKITFINYNNDITYTNEEINYDK